MNLRLPLLVMALVGLTAGSACTGHCATPASPCSLLTQAQASATLGVQVGAGKEEGQFDCEWDQQGVPMFRGVRLFVHVVGPAGTLTPVQQFNTMKTPVPFNKAIVKTPASGIGDEAVYISAPGPPGVSLNVRKGESVFQVRIQGFPGNPTSQVEAMEKSLALNVLAKM